MIIKKKLVLISLILFITILSIQNVFAHKANSSSYSVDMFGTGMATATPSSVNYNSTILSESKGTTRNAESDSYTVNVGFFNDTTPYQTVSITSYSISPASVVVGSTISLYISASYYQSLWAKITSPNSQEQILSLINGQTVDYVPSPSVVGTYEVIFYANSSTGAITSVVDYFELTAQPITPPSGGGGRDGSTITIIEKCTYNWDCTPWGVCSDGKQIRECKNIGTCNGTESKPIEEMNCSESLFDIFLRLKNIELTGNKTLKFMINLTEQMGIEKIDTHIKYSIIDNEGYEIFSQIETKAIQKSLFYEKEIDEIKLGDGEYTLRVDIIYGNLQRAFAEQKFEIKNGKLGYLSSEEGMTDNLLIFTGGLIFLIILIILIIFIAIKLIIDKGKEIRVLIAKGKEDVKRRRIENSKEKYELLKKLYKSKYEGNVLIYTKIKDYYDTIIKTIKNNPLLSTIALLSLFIILATFNKDITGLIISDSIIKNRSWNLFGFIFWIGVLGLLIFINRKNIIEMIEHKNRDKYSKRSIGGLMKRKVYTEEGEYVGKIEGVILGKNKIESLKIRLDKRKKIRVKGIIVKYKNVKSAGHIVIVDNKILEHLNKS